MDPPKVLLIGYSGANNTGAEALLQADIEDLRAVLGDDALLTVPAAKDPENLRRYLHEGPSLAHRSDAFHLPERHAASGPRARPRRAGRGQRLHGHVDVGAPVVFPVGDSMRSP